ncbi:MAG: intradiol ring-cleavage dioxygenase [Gemmataceae bacterium]|nr:intradiol ring-cleavage dioxygenase [Gemmataceae bacterium]
MGRTVLIPTRRLFLGSLGGSIVAASGVRASDNLVITPKHTEGPFYPTKLPVDTDNDLIRVNDSKAAALGTVSHVSGRVLDLKGTPIRNAVVEIWQCDNNGAYLHQGSSNGDKRDTGFQGFGRFTTASNGEYYFRTIKPVPYPGRTPHIHFKITRSGKELLTTQLFIRGLPQNDRDGIFRAVRDERARMAMTAEFTPMKDGPPGELAARFDIVLGVSPEA